MTNRLPYFGYDKTIINKIIKTDIDKLIRDTKIEMIINSIIFSLSEAEKHNISKKYILRKVRKYLGMGPADKPIVKPISGRRYTMV